MNKIMSFLRDGHLRVFDFLPDAGEIEKVSKEWVCNVCATVLKDVFTNWLKVQIKRRNEKVIDKRDMNIEMDEDVLAAFKESNSVSRK